MLKPYEFVDVWLVGDTDGYNHHFNSNLASTSKSKAELMSKTQYGNYGIVSQRKAIKIGNDYFIVQGTIPLDMNGDTEKMKETLRQSALFKLTDAEKEALNL